MSVSFCWEVVPTKRRTFERGISRDRSALERTFGGLPFEFGEAHLNQLIAMHHATGEDETLYNDIARAVETYGKIRVWPEY